MPRAEISGFDRTRIVALFQAGFSNHRIALDLGIPRSSVIRTIQRFQETGSVENGPRSGRPRVTDDRGNRYIALLYNIGIDFQQVQLSDRIFNIRFEELFPLLPSEEDCE
ncbi:unnamed protein product [Acanthoscelides obtectus]|uniref:Paired domain-containing protein n=1 Tax=Acanthoscelides obtectus TaxID=200917 RepID=A0A9P0Q5I3_ACAOB|nr:unnamed protein product [Acanthoscelides obtectus]CAK1655663.1 hypothetical protein AOBTE_LOCUS19245 [Acanthoscelides obtectus]